MPHRSCGGVLDKALCLSKIDENVSSREISTKFSFRKFSFAEQVEILLLDVSEKAKSQIQLFQPST